MDKPTLCASGSQSEYLAAIPAFIYKRSKKCPQNSGIWTKMLLMCGKFNTCAYAIHQPGRSPQTNPYQTDSSIYALYNPSVSQSLELPLKHPSTWANSFRVFSVSLWVFQPVFLACARYVRSGLRHFSPINDTCKCTRRLSSRTPLLNGLKLSWIDGLGISCSFVTSWHVVSDPREK